MENKQKNYLDKVVEFLVRDTKIDHDKVGSQFPFFIPSPSLSLRRLFPPLPSRPFPPGSSSILFSKYCKNVYGLTEDEIKYVWDQYRTIILDKITIK